MKARLNYIDYMKTIGIYLIVLGHMFPKPGTIFIYSFSVPLFFFISGFLFSRSETFGSFLIKNIKSLIVPYLFINVICLFVLLCFNADFSMQDSLKSLLGILIGANQGKMSVCAVTKPTWFIYTLFFLRIGLFFISSIRKVYVIAITFLCMLIAWFLNKMSLLNLAIFNCFSVAPIFILGYVCKRNINSIEKITKTKYGLLHIFLVFAILLFSSSLNGYVMCYAHNYGNNMILFYINALLGVYCLYLITTIFKYNVSCRWNQIISKGTILILGFHYLLIILFNKICHTDNLIVTMICAFLILVVFIPIIELTLKSFPWIIGKHK